MKLSSFLDYNSIVIQCHDNPDADAICSGYVLYRYFEKHDKKVRFIYSGNFEISKSNLVYLIKKLNNHKRSLFQSFVVHFVQSIISEARS